jgi:fucose permease
MGVLIALAVIILTSLLPTYLYEKGFPLNIGGRTVFLFGLGGAFGSLFWGTVAHRRNFGLAFRGSLGVGIPLLLLYLFLASRAWAFWLLLPASFFLYAAFPLIVTLARHSISAMTLGKRLGLIVGGSWGIAALILMGLGPLGERIGILPILFISALCYLTTFIYSLFTLSGKR